MYNHSNYKNICIYNYVIYYNYKLLKFYYGSKIYLHNHLDHKFYQ